MKLIRLKQLIEEYGTTQAEIGRKLGWRKEKLSKLLHGAQHVSEQDMAELAWALGTTIADVRFACQWRPMLNKTLRACPWCNYVISIIEGRDAISTMDNTPDVCPECRNPLDIVIEEDEGIWWLKRGA